MRVTILSLIIVVCLLPSWALPTAQAQATCEINPGEGCQQAARGEACTGTAITPLATAPATVEAPRLLKVQGMIPDILTEQYMTIVHSSVVSLHNAVTDEERVVPAVPVVVQPTVTARLRAAPTTETDIVGGVEAGTTLHADAITADGEWLRVAWQNSSAWVSQSLVTGNVGSLPIYRDGYGDYQAFTVAFDAPCGMLLLQTPRVTSLRVRANGAEMILNNSVVLDSPEVGWLRVTALDGGVRLADGVRVPRGFSALLAMDDENHFTGEVRPPRPMTQMQMEAYTPLTALPPGIVNEPVTLPQGKFIRPGPGDDSGM
ncbi:MAG: SH3 domain-containing protein [Chloroflexota bacterium]